MAQRHRTAAACVPPAEGNTGVWRIYEVVFPTTGNAKLGGWTCSKMHQTCCSQRRGYTPRMTHERDVKAPTRRFISVQQKGGKSHRPCERGSVSPLLLLGSAIKAALPIPRRRWAGFLGTGARSRAGSVTGGTLRKCHGGSPGHAVGSAGRASSPLSSRHPSRGLSAHPRGTACKQPRAATGPQRRHQPAALPRVRHPRRRPSNQSKHGSLRSSPPGLSIHTLCFLLPLLTCPPGSGRVSHPSPPTGGKWPCQPSPAKHLRRPRRPRGPPKSNGKSAT